MKNKYGVDLELVIENAQEQGIDLSEVFVFYSGLSAEEERTLAHLNLWVEKTSIRVIAKLHPEGIALFPDKVSEVYTLWS